MDAQPDVCRPAIAAETISEADVARLEAAFKALADRHRLRILNRLLAADADAVCVCEFEAMLGLSQPSVSYHLKLLLRAGIVEREKRGSYAFYRLADGALEGLIAELSLASVAA